MHGRKLGIIRDKEEEMPVLKACSLVDLMPIQQVMQVVSIILYPLQIDCATEYKNAGVWTTKRK